MANPLIDVMRAALAAEQAPWVLFAGGTVVVLRAPEPTLEQQAIGLLKKWGPVVVATPAGDFNVLELKQVPGWIVTSHHEDIFTYVTPDEVGGAGASDLFVGLTGRSKRDQDARELATIHVEAHPRGPSTTGDC